MDDLRDISIRGRMAYLICSFEKLLQYYNCNIEEWRIVLEKLWMYTSIDYLDDWMYEFAEYLPDSILEDKMDDAEYITEDEFKYMYNVYSNSNADINAFLHIMFECGTCEIYSKLCENSPATIKKITEAINILRKNNITLVDVKLFGKYKYSMCNGWGEKFDGKNLSLFLN